VLVRGAYDAQVLVREAWTETVEHPAEYAPSTWEKDPETGETVEVKGELVKEAWTEVVAEYPAEYETVHHDAEYTTVYHEGYWE
jgi:hypothetical protein